MGLDWRKFWADPWKVMCDGINHGHVRGRSQSILLSGMGSSKQVQLNPADASGKGVVWAPMLWGISRGCWASAASEGSRAWRAVKSITLATSLLSDHQRKDTIWPKAELPDEPAHGTSLHPALPGGWNPKPEMSHCNDLNFLLLTYAGPERINRMYIVLEKPNSVPYTVSAESSLGKNVQTGKLRNIRKDGTSKRMGWCIPKGWRD